MNDEQALEYIKNKLDKHEVRIDKHLSNRSYLRYIRDRNKGILLPYVDEYEKRILNKIKEKKGESKEMEERKVLVRLTKDYQVVEVGVENIDTELDFEREKEWALSQARELLGKVSGETQTPKQHKRETQRQEQKPRGGEVTLEDITLIPKSKENPNGVGTEKQHKILVQGINNGLFSLEEINSFTQYNQVKEALDKVFGK